MARRKHSMRTLFLDIETYPAIVKTWSLFPRYISHKDVVIPGYMLCFAAQWETERTLIFKTNNDADFLSTLYDLLDEADQVVWYNGDAFDAKHINRELVTAGYGRPSPYHSLDLYKVVKKHFKFQSNKLDYVCQELGLGEKVSHEGVALWDACSVDDKKAWAKMERYNKRDITILKRLYKHLLPWIGSRHANAGMFTAGNNRPTCPSCGSTNLHARGVRTSKTNTYQRYQCQTCSSWSSERRASAPSDPNVLRSD